MEAKWAFAVMYASASDKIITATTDSLTCQSGAATQAATSHSRRPCHWRGKAKNWQKATTPYLKKSLKPK
ncbi:MAG: hypothetical protein OXF90_11880 [Chloroflexi bacterium]|nr:hypothetical protein [Chloroflexota bacterium]